MIKNIVFVVFLAILVNYLYQLYNENIGEEIIETSEKIKIFTKDELKNSKSIDEKLYLGILGNVYDVSKGAKHYGPGGSYDFFVGK